MKINTFKDIVNAAKAMPEKTCIAVAEAHDEHTLDAVIKAQADGMIEAILIGDEDKIRDIIASEGGDPARFTIIPSPGIEESLAIAVREINEGRAGAIMKGRLETRQFVKALVNRENGLLTGGLLSLMGFYELERYHKLLAISDLGLNTYPDLEGKRKILENAVRMWHALGVEEPKVAVMASVEKVNPKMPEAVDGDALKTMNINGEITGCIVEGPISFDLATSAEAARIKGYESPVAGDADLLLVHDITAGNMLAKCMTGFAGAQTAGIILGARIPVIMTSRSAEASDKYYSIALAAYAAESR